MAYKVLRLMSGGTVLLVTEPRVVTIGRDPGNDLVVAGERVSRVHARLEPADEGWLLVDASTNGTFVGGIGVRRDRITDGTILVELGPSGPVVTIQSSDVAPFDRPGVVDVPPTNGVRRGALPMGQAPLLSIGRTPENDIVVDDLSVSRHHAELRHDGAHAVIVDRGSHNGTYVNGLRVRHAPVKEQDIVAVGSVRLRYRGGTLDRSDATDESWLCARRVGAVRGRNLVLRDVDLAIAPASLVAIVGPSGAGKTTLMDTLTGNVPPSSGSVSYGGQSILHAESEYRLRLGYVPQDDLIHTQLSVEQALKFAARLRFPPDVSAADRSARVNEVMRELGLSERATLAVGRLSGGQRKRTSIAVELLTRPALLFLDEPTSGLDPGNEELVMSSLRDLARGGRIVVVTTHALANLEMCDRVLFLAKGGHVAFYGPPQEAPHHFEAIGVGGSYPAIFRSLEEATSIEWTTRFRQQPSYERYVADPLRASATSVIRDPDAHAARRIVRPSVLRQTLTLTRRYLALIMSEPRVVALFLIQAPLFALLFVLLFPNNVMTTSKASEVTMLLWLMVIAVTWLGTSNAIREVVKERAIIRREANVGVSMTAYFLSKFAVLGAITVFQAILLTVLVLLPHQLPAPGTPELSIATDGSILSSQRTELVVDLAIVGLAAMAVGLFISTLVKSSDQAMLLLPLILVAHVVVSAPIFRSPSGPLAVAALGSSAAWGAGATASTVDLNQIRRPFVLKVQQMEADAAGPGAVPEGGSPDRRQWDHDAVIWMANIAGLLLITLTATTAAWAQLAQQGARGSPLDRQA